MYSDYTNLETAATISRIDERTALIKDKLDSICEWKEEIVRDVAILNSADLPNRVSRLENWRWYIAGATILLIGLVGLGRIIEFLYVVPRD